MRSERQLALAVGLRDDASFENYWRGANTEAVAALVAGCRGGASSGSIYLWGAVGAGKTHLLQAACREAGQAGLTTAYVPLAAHAEFDPVMMEGLEELALLCIDDVQAVAGQEAWEQALFHLYNRIYDRGSQLVVAGRASVPQLGLALPDLRSRLAWGHVFHLTALDDEGKLAALMLRARGRGLTLPDDVARYLIRRQRRDMISLFDLLERLDAATLAAQRKLTVPFVREWLAKSKS